MDCERARALISAQLDGELSAAEAAALQAHLETCADCREERRWMQQLDAALPAYELEPPAQLHDAVMQRIRSEGKTKKRRVWIPAAAIAAAAALVLLAGRAGLIQLPGLAQTDGITVKIGEAAEQIFSHAEPGAPVPAEDAAREAAQLAAQTGLDVVLVWQSGTPAELAQLPSEQTQTGARLYRVTGSLAQQILDEYSAAVYAADRDFSDLPEQEAACVLVSG